MGMPKLRFGAGAVSQLGDIVSEFDVDRVLVVTGGRSLDRSGGWDRVMAALRGITISRATVSGEPSPEVVDAIVSENRSVQAVIGVGGGSVMDAGKAVAAMLTCEGSVEDYLEGVGTSTPAGTTLPLVAVPTTSGTGSEATKNAVISRSGENGFKKSLRHDAYIPAYAVVDPELTLACPPEITAASGLDAVTQLLEAYVSTEASPLTDALCESGLKAAASLPSAVRDGGDIEVRGRLAYAAYLSGVVLAHAGLGIVHGIASPVGARFPVPHGVVCGSLIGAATEKIIARTEDERTLGKYALVGRFLGVPPSDSVHRDCEGLVGLLTDWIDAFGIPRLNEYGIARSDLPGIADLSGLKNTPAMLEPGDIEDILRSHL